MMSEKKEMAFIKILLKFFFILLKIKIRLKLSPKLCYTQKERDYYRQYFMKGV